VLYAKVVLGLPLEGPFDYRVLAGLEEKIKIGSRVWVNFRNKKEVAYVVGLGNKSKIKKLKEITLLIDQSPILDERLLRLTESLAQYYCCSWGQAIDACVPDELRRGKEIKNVQDWPLGGQVQDASLEEQAPLFVQGFRRLPVYLREAKKALDANESVIILCSNMAGVENVKKLVGEGLNTEVFTAFRKQPKELEVWGNIRQIDHCVVVGLRSAIFAPVNKLGLIIVDQPEDQVYKQEQAPHYHAVWAALKRARIEGAKVILGSHSLSLEGFYSLQKNKLKLEVIVPEADYPSVQVIDLRRLPYAERKTKPVFSKFLLDAIQAALEEKGRVLLVINRKGFATTVACHNCGAALKCPRCNINLVFHFDENRLKCHHCNFKMITPKICPNCNAGYIKYFGLGTEKVESELARIFPLARLGEDIVVATGSVINQEPVRFDLIGVLGIDDLLNRVDFQASEKAFSLLTGLANLTTRKVIIQSANANHHCFQSLVKNNPLLFLEEELKTRKQLNFPPFKHMILMKIRGANLNKVKEAATALFQRLSNTKTSSLKLLSLNPGQPPKLRGNFYYQILMRASSVQKAGPFLKLHLKTGHFSGIITTVDVDPV